MGFLNLPKKQRRRKAWKDGGTHMSTGKKRVCPNCGSTRYGKKKYRTFMGDVISGTYCSNCGHNKPGGVLI